MEILKQADLKNSESTFESEILRKRFLEKYKGYGLMNLRVDSGAFEDRRVTNYDLKKEDQLPKLVRDFGNDTLSLSFHQNPQAQSYMQTYVTMRQPVMQCSALSVLSRNDYNEERWGVVFDLAYLLGYTIVTASYNTQFTDPDKAKEGFGKLGFKHFLTYKNRRTNNQIFQMYKHLEPCL